MHMNVNNRRAVERVALRNVINQWNANRLDLFELSEPNEDLEFHGVIRFYFQESGEKVATKCVRVDSDATVEDVIETLVEKFRPDMRMLSVASYALYELHEGCPERKMSPEEKPLLVQLNWHVDDREGRFLLKNIDDKTLGSIDLHASVRRKLSKRERKQLKKQLLKSEITDNNKDGVAVKLYTELPETSFTRSISNPEAVMRRRRQQKFEKKLQQFRARDGESDTGGTLKIYGEALCKDVPYKTLLLSVQDCAGAVVKEMLDKYGLTNVNPTEWCLVQVTQQPEGYDSEYVLGEDESPLSILMNAPDADSITFHVRPVPREQINKPGANSGDLMIGPKQSAPFLVELGADGSARKILLTNDVIEVGSANGIAMQLYGSHIQPKHCVVTKIDRVVSLTPCHEDAYTYVNGERIYQTTILTHGSIIKFGHSNVYKFLDPAQEDKTRYTNTLINQETTRDSREDNCFLSSSSANRLSGIPSDQDAILPLTLELLEKSQDEFLARVIPYLDTMPTFRLAPAFTLYLCARYRVSTRYRPELTPTQRAHKLTLLLKDVATLILETVQDRSSKTTPQAFWLANASELLHFLKSDKHVNAFSLKAEDTLTDAVQLSFKNLVVCITDALNSALRYLLSVTGDENPIEVINILGGAMILVRKCRVNAALTIQLFSRIFHWISAKALLGIISDNHLCTKNFGNKLFNRLRNLQAWAESQGLELAAECHLAKIVQCAHLLRMAKFTPDDLANISLTCFKLNSMQLVVLLRQYTAEPGEKIAPLCVIEQAINTAVNIADELARAEGREITLYEDPVLPQELILPDDGFCCDIVQGIPPGLTDFLHPLQDSGLCKFIVQPTSAGHWTVYMTASRSFSGQPEVQVIRLHKAGGGLGLSIVADKGAGQARLGIYIKSLVPGGAADRDGRLAAGDQLLSVDGKSLLDIPQEKAAEFLVRSGSVVTLEVAKGSAIYHGLATILEQSSPTPRSKSVPTLNHLSSNSGQPRNTHDVFNTCHQNGAGLRSRSTHNVHQRDGGFYQNLNVYKNKVSSTPQLEDRTSVLRRSQNSLPNSQRPSSAYYPLTISTATSNNLHQSIPNLKSPPVNPLLVNDASRSGSFPLVNHSQNYGNYNTYHARRNYPKDHDRVDVGPTFSPPFTSQNNSNSYSTPNYPNNIQQLPHIKANGQQHSNTGGGHENFFMSSQSERMSIRAHITQQPLLTNDERHLRSQIGEHSKEILTGQNRMSPTYPKHIPNDAYFYPQQEIYYNQPPNYNMQMSQITQNHNHHNPQENSHYPTNVPMSPPFKPTTVASRKPTHDVWPHEEQASPQEHQIREQSYRSAQQDEHLQILQLEREFQIRVQEAVENDDNNIEKESQHLPPAPPLESEFVEIKGKSVNSAAQSANSLQIEEHIRQTKSDGTQRIAIATPSVIGTQEVYKDPMTKRLQEQENKKKLQSSSPVPEELSFQEKIKMFAMEIEEQGTSKYKNKVTVTQKDA